MIENQSQYLSAIGQLQKFEEALESINQLPDAIRDRSTKTNPPFIRKAQMDALRAHIDRLRRAIGDYQQAQETQEEDWGGNGDYGNLCNN